MSAPDWFGAWTEYLQAVHPRHDWPDAEHAAYWHLIADEFDRRGISRDLAFAAAKHLATNPPQWATDILPSLLRIVDVMRGQDAAIAAGVPENREDAEAASRGCRTCSGQGLVSRPWTFTRRDGTQVQSTASLYCNQCAMGRWMKHAHENGDPKTRRVLPDLGDHPELWYADEQDDRLPGSAVASQLRAMIAGTWKPANGRVARQRPEPVPFVEREPTEAERRHRQDVLDAVLGKQAAV
jgi:hypothetical protein